MTKNLTVDSISSTTPIIKANKENTDRVVLELKKSDLKATISLLISGAALIAATISLFV